MPSRPREFWQSLKWLTLESIYKAISARDAEIAREAKREMREAANLFGARVKERCPSWFEEPAGSTDFAEARDALAVLLAAPAAAQGAKGEEPTP